MLEITVPVLAESIESAVIVELNMQKGQRVVANQALVALSTDKITVEVVAPCDGTIAEVFVSLNEEVRVGKLMAKLSAELSVENTKILPEKNNKPQQEVNLTPQPQKDHPVEGSIHAKLSSMNYTPGAEALLAENIKHVGEGALSELERVFDNNLLIKYEDVLNILNYELSLNNLQGGLWQNLTTNFKEKTEFLQCLDRAKETNYNGETGLDYQIEKMSPLRLSIANNLKNAQNTAAILTTFNEVIMDPIMELRQQYQAKFVDEHGVKLGFMSFFVRACAKAFKYFSHVNSVIKDGNIIKYKHAHINVAIGSDRGLFVPVLKNCEALSFSQIEKQIINYAQQAKEGKITLESMSGGTFTISNGGTYGSLLSTPIINGNQSAILGMHKIEKRAVVVDDRVVIKNCMYLALSYDHRLIDGKEAVGFLVRVKEYLENPIELMLN